MQMSRIIVMGLAAAALGMGGCQNSLKTQNAALTEEISGLRAQLSDRNSALESCNQELRSRDQQLAELRRSGTGTATANTGYGGTGFDHIPGVTGAFGAGEVTASVESDLLFDSGKTTLKPAAKKSLDQVASVLNTTYGGAAIRVAGHTDTDPIRKSGHKSNYHLGFERAWAVREYLISKGVSPKRLSLASHGPDLPRGSKPQSRRVEIVVLLNSGGSTASAAGR